MKIDMYGSLCMIVGAILVNLVIFKLPLFVGFLLGLTASYIMIYIVPKKWRINADQ